jgi:RNA-directed DNA polymerase
VVLCGSQEEAQQVFEEINQWVEENGLQMHLTKTRIVVANQRGGFDFLGYHFERGKKWPRKKSLDKLKDAVRSKTRRNNGRCMKAICEDLNLTLKGWYGYFQHSVPYVFESMDGYVRGRLRSILRRRRKRKGRAKRTDHYRWPNTYFSNTNPGIPGIALEFLTGNPVQDLRASAEGRLKVENFERSIIKSLNLVGLVFF